MTVGLGGHTAALAAATAPGGRVLGLDRDAAALALARARRAEAGERVRLVHAPFSRVADVAADEKITDVAGILMDLGVSSMQFDDAARGFSCTQDGPLDMRMDTRQATTAADIVNTWHVEALTRTLRELGGEPLAGPIARAIARRREKAPFTRTMDLARLVSGVYYARGWRRSTVHPATRVFQALRMAVNDEAGELRAGLAGAWTILKDGGRLAVISFHSGEDKVVKEYFNEQCRHGAGTLLTRKPRTASADECARNPRARSAKLRACQRGGGQ
jgi:16S rRNA (cytosine1402-N4)-methyltransferase